MASPEGGLDWTVARFEVFKMIPHGEILSAFDPSFASHLGPNSPKGASLTTTACTCDSHCDLLALWRFYSVFNERLNPHPQYNLGVWLTYSQHILLAVKYILYYMTLKGQVAFTCPEDVPKIRQLTCQSPSPGTDLSTVVVVIYERPAVSVSSSLSSCGSCVC